MDSGNREGQAPEKDPAKLKQAELAKRYQPNDQLSRLQNFDQFIDRYHSQKLACQSLSPQVRVGNCEHSNNAQCPAGKAKPQQIQGAGGELSAGHLPKQRNLSNLRAKGKANANANAHNSSNIVVKNQNASSKQQEDLAELSLVLNQINENDSSFDSLANAASNQPAAKMPRLNHHQEYLAKILQKHQDSQETAKANPQKLKPGLRPHAKRGDAGNEFLEISYDFQVLKKSSKNVHPLAELKHLTSDNHSLVPKEITIDAGKYHPAPGNLPSAPVNCQQLTLAAIY